LRNHKNLLLGTIAVVQMIVFYCSSAWAREPYGNDASQLHSRPAYHYSVDQTLIGILQGHIIQAKETLLDVARQYDLGFNEISDLYPHLDPWIPPRGTRVIIPSQWVLPEIINNGILVNIAELRLYYFDKNRNCVMTFPIGIGDKGTLTPVGMFSIKDKQVHPIWYIPSSLKHKYAVGSIPPGPDNPLGDFWMGLGESHYGIHGTDLPWSVGRLVTHGCIRMYNEDIALLFQKVPVGAHVKLIYEPVKIGRSMDRIFVEVHPDIYGRVGDLVSYGFALLHAKKIVQDVDDQKYRQALMRKDGLPTDVTRPIGSE
jgi:L,D-transpeptidase ErfK/SrfK